VADEYAGKEAQCPVCNAIYVVPSIAPPNSPGDYQSANPVQYYVQIPTGAEFGPVPSEIIEQWIRENRVNEVCQFRVADRNDWTSFLEWPSFASTRSKDRSETILEPPVGSKSLDAFGSISIPVDNRIQYPKPSRGWTVLILSLSSILLCFTLVGSIPLAIIALIVGSKDLGSIRRGTTSPEQRRLTLIGMAIAGIVLLLNSIALILMVFARLFGL